MKVKAYLVRAFTKDASQGNPAGVILNTDLLTETHMQSIATNLNFSESAFIQMLDKTLFSVRFFSPKQEVNFCGHATLAAFHILLQEKIIKPNKEPITVKEETKAGIFPVTCYNDGKIVMRQNTPQFFPEERDKQKIAALLSISPNDILNFPIQTVSTSVPKLIIPIKSQEALMAIQPNSNGITEYCQNSDARGFYAYTSETQEKEDNYQARQFNPLAGIDEDPITGVAAGALAAYLYKENLSPRKPLIIEQGYNLGMGGKMYVSITDEVQVGGYAITYGEKTFDLDTFL